MVRDKLAAYGIETISITYSGDGVDNVAGAISEARNTGADMILCTGGMSVDPDDNTPGGIKQSGARIVTYGAPVLPGAMFLLGYFEDGTPIMGLPGCVMYAGATIFDLALPRIAAGVEKVVLMLSYPSDEVGNHLVSLDQLDEAGIDPWHDVLDLEQFRAAFGKVIHPFTGVDYVDFYKGIIEDAGAQAEIVFANRVQTVLDYTDTVICCDIHTRQRSKRLLKKAGARVVLGLDDLLTAPVNGSGYNPQYGLLGSNKADDTRVKLFPRDADVVAEAIGQRLSEATGKRIEAMVYGDGAFKDPVGKIWELADPVVSPGYTAGLEGTPNELKLKYLADHDFGDLSGEALQQAVAQKIREKDASVSLVGNMVSEGTTPRHLTDLIGSLCDLTSGSGDKGTPVIYIQGYFDNYTNE